MAALRGGRAGEWNWAAGECWASFGDLGPGAKQVLFFFFLYFYFLVLFSQFDI
jgi:hypothetical protein